MDKEGTFMGWSFAAIIAAVGAFWGGVDPWVKALFLLSLLDILAAVVVAISVAGLDLKKMELGIQKKAMMAILITASIIVQTYVTEQIGYSVPLTTAVAGFYVGLEFLSILKHAYAIGLRIPKPLIDVGTRIDQFTGGSVGDDPPKPAGGGAA